MAIEFQRLFRTGFTQFQVLKLAVERGLSIARLGDPGEPIGTGVLVPGALFHPAFGNANVLLTTYHVARSVVVAGGTATATLIDFREARHATLAKHVVFISPETDLDAAVIVLEEEPWGVPPVPVRCLPSRELVGAVVYAAGHPNGEELQYSYGKVKDECGKFLYHQASTLPGSSGSGIFASGSGDLVAVHHAAVDRFGGRWYLPARWQNRGVKLAAIVETARSLPAATIVAPSQFPFRATRSTRGFVAPRGHRKPSLRALAEDEILPGDVVLTRGKGHAADGICCFSGGIYSHATIWLGDGLVEAALPDVHRLSPRALAQKSRFGQVFRHRLSDPELGAPAVVEVVNRSFMAREYSVAELVVATAISTLTLWANKRSAAVAQWIAEGAGELLEGLRPWWEEHTQGSVTCCELVVKAFAKVDLPIHVQVDVAGELDLGLLWKAYSQLRHLQAMRRGVAFERVARAYEEPLTRGDVHWLARAQRAVAVELTRAPIFESTRDLHGKVIVAPGTEGDEAWSPALVTPRQLHLSEDLVPIGLAPKAWWR